MKSKFQKPKKTETTELFHADQAQGADYFKPQNSLRENASQAPADVEAKSVPGSKPAAHQTRKPS